LLLLPLHPSGCKQNDVRIVYTPWGNLKKTASMDVGQVGLFKAPLGGVFWRAHVNRSRDLFLEVIATAIMAMLFLSRSAVYRYSSCLGTNHTHLCR
jgi:hypothetical protein